ncbi:MAG: hypothetical protein LBI92_00355 [Azoarcus sp.]|jgi:hypothetical protein|nr:hypothetical protein [Azoarcus sp.]
MATADQVKMLEAANKCLAKRVDIPGAPLWHMGKVYVFESDESFKLLDNTVKYLECKARAKMPFEEDEKEFMKELFEASWWGGLYKGYKEAGKLSNHYVNGHGADIQIDADVYKTSVIVKDTMDALKAYIRKLAEGKQSRSFAHLRSNDTLFLQSEFARKLRSGRNVNMQGSLLEDGVLIAEQSNTRLKFADHRFHLSVSTSKASDKFYSTWKVESLYDFQPFSNNEEENKRHITHLPLGHKELNLPDGLSQYMTEIGVAKAFNHVASWDEWWK